jgi:hypothetical protein
MINEKADVRRQYKKTCEKTSITLTSMMKEGFVETATNKVVYNKSRHHFFRSYFKNRFRSQIFCFLDWSGIECEVEIIL